MKAEVQVDPSELVLDDGMLLADRIVRSLHRNADGHLSTASNNHKRSIEHSHNVAVLYLYSEEEPEAYVLHEHYVYNPKPANYFSWRRIVHDEVRRVLRTAEVELYGVYGWVTSHVPITPLRNGDLFIKIDEYGARGVRLTFGSTEGKHGAHSKTKTAKRGRNRHRSRQ
jgi:hypothetical protein